MKAEYLFGDQNAYRMKTKTIMICECGNTLHQGSGRLATDYMCDRCGSGYDSAGRINYIYSGKQ